MKNTLRTSFNFSGFEPIGETHEKKLMGGFSVAHASLKGFKERVNGNNCAGQNCADGCTGGDPQNTKCNTVTNCGVIKAEY